MIIWDVSRIIETAGGIPQLRRLLARADQEVPDSSAVSMWKSRNRLPGQWSAPVVWVVLAAKPKLSATDLMMTVASADDALFAEEPVP